jgi:ribulose bisphosphate carboxylase small subunit
VCLTALAAIGSTVITQQIMTELSSGFNSIGFVASDQVKTIELSWSSSVLHLETTSRMFKVFQSYPGCMFFD